MGFDTSEAIQILVESVRLLAAEPEVQIAAFPSFVHIPDEIALTLGEAHEMFSDRLHSTGHLPSDIKDMLCDLDDLLARMSRGGDLFTDALWTLEGVRTASVWSDVRKRAATLLQAWGQEKKEPRLFWMQYVES